MYEFYKHDGNLTEGYLGEPENFSGIVFLLKEPNNKTQATEFWFKKVLQDSIEYHKNLKENGTLKKDITRSKRTFSAFKNRFSEMLLFIGSDEKCLNNSIFCNIHPEYGADTETKAVNKAIKENADEMLCFFATLKNEITVFTCIDIYKYLLESEKIQNKIQEHGLTYTNKDEPLSCFKCEIGNTKVTVYEIIHPSRSSKILYK